MMMKHVGLHPNFWQENKLKRRVLKGLLQIANDFWDGVEHGSSKLTDVTLTGSLATSRWSNQSDVDLHLIVKLPKGKKLEELMTSYFKARGRLWNLEHDIEVYGFPVEIYVQDVDQPHYSEAVYSLKDEKWLQREEPQDYPNEEEVSKKADVLSRDISEMISDLETQPSKANLKRAKKLQEKIKKIRQSGLEKEGVSSAKNLAFKAVRRLGLIDDLAQCVFETYDKVLMDALEQ